MDDTTIQNKRARRSIRWGKLSCLFATLIVAILMFIRLMGFPTNGGGPEMDNISPDPLPFPLAILWVCSVLMALAIPVVSFIGLVLGVIDITKGPQRVPPLIGILLSVLPFVAVFLFLLILCC